jgi:ABC-2 type transport system ATP-binding protein
VGIAQAIIHKPKLVILDEPISGLDPVQIVEMRRVIRGLAEECTVLVSSHILSEIEQTCDRILVLQAGRLVFEGEGETLRERKQGATTLALTLRGSADVVRSALNDQAGVTLLDITESANELVELRLELTEDRREDVVHALVLAGLGLRRLEEEGDELEDVFVALTKSAGTTGGDR